MSIAYVTYISTGKVTELKLVTAGSTRKALRTIEKYRTGTTLLNRTEPKFDILLPEITNVT